MTDFVNTIDLYGDETVAEKFIRREIEEFADDVISKIGDYAFFRCTALTSVNLPNVTSVGSYCFSESSVVTAYLPKAKNISNSMFGNCKNLASVDLSSAELFNGAAFVGCIALTEVKLPKLNMSVTGFGGCTALQKVICPNANEISASAFNGCRNLRIVDTSAGKIGNAAFQNCENLHTIVLRGNTMCTLGSTTAFNNTPFAAGKAGGTVYCPQSLIESYQNATNWSTLYAAGTCNFVAIEGSEYE